MSSRSWRSAAGGRNTSCTSRKAVGVGVAVGIDIDVDVVAVV